MNKNPKDGADPGDRRLAKQTPSVCISAAQFREIERAGRLELSHELRAEIEIVLNSYILRHGWDRNTRPSKETKAHLQLLGKHVGGLLQALDDVNRKFSSGGDFHPGIALEDQWLFHRAGIDPVRVFDQLLSLSRALEAEADETELDRGGRPKDFFLPQFFCELEEIYLKAGGCRIGVTRTLNDTRESQFADFVNAILRFAPA